MYGGEWRWKKTTINSKKKKQKLIIERKRKSDKILATHAPINITSFEVK